MTADRYRGMGRLASLVLPPGVQTRWQYDAACQEAPDPEVFFPGKSDSGEAAKQVCAGCPVTGECLEFALATMPAADRDHGVYGGLTPAERARLRGGPALVRDHRLDSKAQAVIGRKLASQVGAAAAARALGVTPKALTDAWQRRGLATVPAGRAARQVGERLDRDRVAAEQALEQASQVGVGRAAATLGVTPAVLHRAWQRHGLDRPALKSPQRPAAPPATADDRVGAHGRTRRSRNGREREEGGARERP